MTDIAGLCAWLAAVLDDEQAALANQDEEAVLRAQLQFDQGMERLRLALGQASPDTARSAAGSLTLLQEAIEAHERYLAATRDEYRSELGSIRAQAQIASYAPVPINGDPTPRYFDRAG